MSRAQCQKTKDDYKATEAGHLQVGADHQAAAGAQRHQRHAHAAARLRRGQAEQQALRARIQPCVGEQRPVSQAEGPQNVLLVDGH